ncbi:MAG TPA: YggT family protein [Solirubrobacteraceae bacterium]|nr:YggT family protein [Solirubrobacteraceae bacterium]
MILALADARTEIAEYVSAVFWVYSLLLIAWIIVSLVLSLGVRIPYARWSSAVIGFLRDVAEPFLRIFRKLGLQIGPLDLSPIVALLVLGIVRSIVVGLIAP